MDEKRYSINYRVSMLANQLDITQVVVKQIITAYLNYCKETLIQGRKIEYFGLVTLIPDKVNDRYISTLAYDCNKIADNLRLPHYTVYTVVNTYLQSMIEDIMQGREAEIRGIVVLKPIIENNQITKVHASTSTALKNYIYENDTEISSVRAHTHKVLKNNLKALSQNSEL